MTADLTKDASGAAAAPIHRAEHSQRGDGRFVLHRTAHPKTQPRLPMAPFPWATSDLPFADLATIAYLLSPECSRFPPAMQRLAYFEVVRQACVLARDHPLHHKGK